MALLVGNVGSALAAWNHIASLFSPHVRPEVANSSRIPARDLDRQQPQAQAEALLERAVSRDDNAPDQITSSTVSSRKHRLRLFSSAPSAAMIMLPIKSRRASINGAEG